MRNNKNTASTRHILAGALALMMVCTAASAQEGLDYQDLLDLFADWREFERPPLLEGAPDYTADSFDERYQSFQVCGTDCTISKPRLGQLRSKSTGISCVPK